MLFKHLPPHTIIPSISIKSPFQCRLVDPGLRARFGSLASAESALPALPGTSGGRRDGRPSERVESTGSLRAYPSHASRLPELVDQKLFWHGSKKFLAFVQAFSGFGPMLLWQKLILKYVKR